jgi:hypothetical protein
VIDTLEHFQEDSMTTRISTAAGLAAGLALGLGLWCGSASAQAQTKPADCPKAGAPEKVEGQVVKVNPNQGTLTVRGPDGTTHEFQASKETLETMKVGDTVNAKLRVPEGCRKS